jgi:hypothetical protein
MIVFLAILYKGPFDRCIAFMEMVQDNRRNLCSAMILVLSLN